MCGSCMEYLLDPTKVTYHCNRTKMNNVISANANMLYYIY